MTDIAPSPAGPFGARGGDASSFTTFIETLTNSNEKSTEINLRAEGQWIELRIHVTGTFDSGSVGIHGSEVSGGTFVPIPLVTSAGVAAAISSAGYATAQSIPPYIKVVTAGGGGSQDIDVYLTAIQKVR